MEYADVTNFKIANLPTPFRTSKHIYFDRNFMIVSDKITIEHRKVFFYFFIFKGTFSIGDFHQGAVTIFFAE